MLDNTSTAFAASVEVSTRKKCKVIVITDIMAPYRIPVFNEIAKDSRLDFKVIFLARMAGERKWNINTKEIFFSFDTTPAVIIPYPRSFPLLFNPQLLQKLCRINPDTIICGGIHHPSYLLTLCYALFAGKRFILWNESHENSVRIKHRLAVFYRRMFIRCSSGYLAFGTQAEKFLLKLGAAPDKIFVTPNAVDNEFFIRETEKFRAQKNELKQARSFPRLISLYVGRLIHSKGVETLLEAFSKLPFQQAMGLIIVGDGAQENEYKRFCRTHHLRNVFFEGFKQQSELPYYYGISDLLVMPSFRDEWGLVLNEAMASGLPVIASDAAGGAQDLIHDGINGYRFQAGDYRSLSRLMTLVLNDEELRINMGKESRTRIEQFSPRVSANGFIRAALGEGHHGQD